MFIPNPLAIPLLMAVAASVLLGAPAGIKIQLRDVETHSAVRATVIIDGSESLSLRKDDAGRLNPALSAGERRIEVSAPGYKRFKTYIRVTPTVNSSSTIMLDPDTPAEELLPEVLTTRLRSGYTLVNGYVVDVDTGKPLQGVRIRLHKANLESRTDGHGYYYVSVPTPPIMGDLPGTETLIAELPGYTAIIRSNFPLVGDQTGFDLDMQRGMGTEEHDDTHKLMQTTSVLIQTQSQEALLGASPISAETYQWIGTTSNTSALSVSGSTMNATNATAVTVPSSLSMSNI